MKKFEANCLEKVYELAKKISEEGFYVGEEPIICIENNKKAASAQAKKNKFEDDDFDSEDDLLDDEDDFAAG